MLWEVLKNMGIIIGVPVIRSAAGWATLALEDNVVTKFEWKQLFKTVVKVGTMGALAYLGLEGFGVDNAAIIAAVIAFFADKLFDGLKKNKLGAQ